jgi:glycosyltransferase involved in cell wall biosynthesis
MEQKVTPVLLVSDSPNGSTGLGMITGQIASLAHQNLSDVCDIAVAGYGDAGENKQPYPVYPFSELNNWTIPQLPWIWKQFAGDRKGIILTVWNVAWLPWMTHPENLQPGGLRDFLMSGRFKLWSYVPVDSVCLNNRLSANEESILRRFDRVLAYTKFGADAIDRTLGNDLGTTLYAPHGTDPEVFYPRDRKEARRTLLSRIGKGNTAVSDDVILVGIFATNTPRKDWPLGIEVCARLVDKGYNIGVLVHTNSMHGNWNIQELCLGFGLQGRTIESTCALNRDDLPWLYAACDVTLGIGSGEGWGMPLSESMAMGVPVVHGRYAGGAEFMPQEWTVEPSGWRYEGPYSNKRPVFDPDDWVKVVESVMIPSNSPRASYLGEEFMWDKVWPKFEKWIREGI